MNSVGAAATLAYSLPVSCSVSEFNIILIAHAYRCLLSIKLRRCDRIYAIHYLETNYLLLIYTVSIHLGRSCFTLAAVDLYQCLSLSLSLSIMHAVTVITHVCSAGWRIAIYVQFLH